MPPPTGPGHDFPKGEGRGPAGGALNGAAKTTEGFKRGDHRPVDHRGFGGRGGSVGGFGRTGTPPACVGPAEATACRWYRRLSRVEVASWVVVRGVVVSCVWLCFVVSFAAPIWDHGGIGRVERGGVRNAKPEGHGG
jgi:hypothetical protein